MERANSGARGTLHYVAAFYLYDDAFCLAGIVVDEDERAIDAFVRAFLAFVATRRTAERAGFDKRERPPLELVAVFAGKLAGTVEVFGLADDAVCRERRPPATPVPPA